ncbi:MFS general substrate transporter [Trichodelitschia bisporula]|uniref:MFS general substrate transporter n=1 Tax=Trichodelitschia bisporula TaxID=703511 RepID=A0A6G1IAW7_9PEZI|nr:MFS general substrate transporter [Trichodelitschia bisporula]
MGAGVCCFSCLHHIFSLGLVMALEKDEKSVTIFEENLSTESESEPAPSDLDGAAIFLDAHKDVDISHIDIVKLRHKIDRCLVPLMCLCFIMQFLDKAIYNYTALMGLPKDLHFKHGDFSNVASGYAFAHLAMQLPNTYLLQRLPASKWLCSCMIGWGLVTLCTASVQNFAGIFVARIFLAITEATIGPSLMLITAQWYRKSEQAPRFAIWHSAPGVGQILGGLMSYAFQVPQQGKLAGWRLMFIALGIITLFVAGLCFYYLPDTPMNSRWLSTEEKVAILKHVSVNMTGISNHKPRPGELLEAAKDVQIYGLALPAVLAAMTSGLTGTYSTTLIKNLGFTSRQSALLNMPSGIVNILSNMIVGFGIRRTSYRWAWGVGCTIPGITGAAMLSFLPQPNAAGSLVGIYLVGAITSISTIMQQWAMANVSGHTKRALTAGVMSACYGIGGILGPQTFQDKYAPRYLPATLTVMATQASCAVVFVCLFQYYLWENRRRDRVQSNHGIVEDVGEVDMSNQDAWAGATDRENPQFSFVPVLPAV